MIDIISGVCSDDPGGVRPVSGAGCSGANRGRTTYTDEQVRESGGGVRLGQSDRILGGLGCAISSMLSRIYLCRSYSSQFLPIVTCRCKHVINPLRDKG